jgi:hypothetical protein
MLVIPAENQLSKQKPMDFQLLACAFEVVLEML